MGRGWPRLVRKPIFFVAGLPDPFPELIEHTGSLPFFAAILLWGRGPEASRDGSPLDAYPEDVEYSLHPLLAISTSSFATSVQRDRWEVESDPTPKLIPRAGTRLDECRVGYWKHREFGSGLSITLCRPNRTLNQGVSNGFLNKWAVCD